ncbi:hypothetical protein LOAG_09535 [Loa loa]|uniref:USP domain-containing protein n=1 Tax=Loa loa TaxID=7209 RepID=A0A1S0TRV9_LOALO|nr:hypothetical protein LOAG_09535 [Loa loa]EFO18959.2 hypothetical protein LOAG_09535 [Loa loa]
MEDLKDLSTGISIIWKIPTEGCTIQKEAILNKEIFFHINQSLSWKPSAKRFKQSFCLGDDTEQDAIETEDLSAKLSELSLADILVHQKEKLSVRGPSMPTSLKPQTFGLMNLGNTCYMSSILQCLFANWIFVQDLYKFCMKIEESGSNLDEDMPLSLAIANLASRRGTAVDQLQIKLLEAIKDTADFTNNAQQDAQEFLGNILNKMQEECDKMLRKQYNIVNKQERDRINPVTSNFTFVMESIIRCRSCNAITKIKEESATLPVSIQVMDQGGFGCLIVFIKRYSFNAFTAVKRGDEVGIPLYLTLNKGFVAEEAKYPALLPTIKKINHNTVRPLGRKFLKVKRRLKPENVANKLNLSAASARSTWAGNANTDALSVVLGNLTIDPCKPDGMRIKTAMLSKHSEASRGELGQHVSADNLNTSAEFKFGQSRVNSSSSDRVDTFLMNEKQGVWRKPLPPREVLDSMLSQELKELRLVHTANLQKRSRQRGQRLSFGYHSDEDVNSIAKQKQSATRKRRISDNAGCDQSGTIPKVLLLKFKEELDAQMIRDLVCQQNIMNDNKENIPPGNPDDIKAKMYLKKSKSFSPSDEMKKMMTYKKMSHHEMTIIPIRYLQINGDKAFCTGKFSHSRNISTTNYTNQDVGNLDDEEVVSTFGLQPIPYKPLSEMKRNEICALIGLLPRDNWMMESSIHWMSMYDQPDFLVVVPGNDNRLFQALAHYITGDDNDFHQIRQAIIQFELEHAAEFMNLKQWDRTTWDYHLNNLLSNVENGSDVELLAFSSMFKVDVWIFRRGRWFCYRPKFPVLKERCRNLSIQQYHIGANEGVYLNYENGLFLPVFKPSVYFVIGFQELLVY